ncbi:hypothetical protein D9V34_00620 [Mycetocola lacteus]|uniref:HEAT repeat domain-containing protein n=1 Tax=Mycetocola lacteus TaxID=76637 RepID=A0A3L7AL68_9MICO|nr:hypothetical protein [Mycetocola lacteus]RLP80755.1 hypothetical protein D9V34_12915 [Mycetocola lacteus]RLP84540.1 hypothetical protein D9V34_00620 [Mycetocola lacteus]
MTATVDLIDAFRSADPDRRARLLRGCEAGADSDRVDFLITLVEDTAEDPAVRTEAARALALIAAIDGEEPGRLFDEELDAARNLIGEILAGVANRDPDEDLRVWALRGLARCDLPDSAIRVLVGLALAEREDPLLRTLAAAAVYAQAPESVVRTEALPVLDHDPILAGGPHTAG